MLRMTQTLTQTKLNFLRKAEIRLNLGFLVTKCREIKKINSKIENAITKIRWTGKKRDDVFP